MKTRHGLIPSYGQPPPEPKEPHIKKPLNAFMLFMREMRPQVIAEGVISEASVVNQSIGRRWRELNESQQSKYYEMAKEEKELHSQLYPGWTNKSKYAKSVNKQKITNQKNKGQESLNAKTSRTPIGKVQKTKSVKSRKTKKK